VDGAFGLHLVFPSKSNSEGKLYDDVVEHLIHSVSMLTSSWWINSKEIGLDSKNISVLAGD
jgi:hypothetical protein